MYGPYQIFLCDGNDKVGITLRRESEGLQGQPVVLQADSPTWYSTNKIENGGPTELRVEPYKYTREYEGEVYATNEPLFGQHWFLRPADCGDYTFTIEAAPSFNGVWTAEGNREPIKIKEFVSGGINQTFRFVHLPQ